MSRKTMAAIAMILVWLLILVPAASAHPSRVRLLVHGSTALTEDLNLGVDFIPAGDLLGEMAPLNYLVLDVRVSDLITLSPVIGWASGADEAIVSLHIASQFRSVWGWADMELNPESMSAYWFVQAQFQFNPWLQAGLEEESWGTWKDVSAMSHGAGPNILISFGKQVRVDFSVHHRTLPDKGAGEELVLRWHMFL